MHAGRQLDRHGSFNSREKDAQTKQGYPNSLLFFAHSFVPLLHFFNLEKTIREQNLSIRLDLHNLTLPFTIDSDRATKKKIARKQKRVAVLKHIAAPLNAIRDTKWACYPATFSLVIVFHFFPCQQYFKRSHFICDGTHFPLTTSFFYFTGIVVIRGSSFEKFMPMHFTLIAETMMCTVPCCCRNRIFYILLNLNLTALTF